MKRGFTLIELLAVIVILAIISLIAVPIVINIINDSKTSSDEQSVELYLDVVEKTITKKQLSNPSFNPNKCEIKDNGDLECYKNNKLIDTLQIEMKGNVPKNGTIRIENNKINYRNIFYENLYYHKNKKNIKSTTKHPKYAELIEDADDNNEVSIGDKYTYQVNDNDVFNFYVLSIEGDKVNLIMDRNICEDGNLENDTKSCKYQWWINDSNGNTIGPIRAIQKLYAATDEWNNVPNMDLIYNDAENDNTGIYGYIGINIIDGNITIVGKDGNKLNMDLINMKTRLPKYSEMLNANCSFEWGSCPDWLMQNLKDARTMSLDISNRYANTSKLENTNGYWLLTSYSNEKMDAYHIYFNGQISMLSIYNNNQVGIRPVITVPIADLE